MVSAAQSLAHWQQDYWVLLHSPTFGLMNFKWPHYFLIVAKIISVNLPAAFCFYWLQSVLTPSLQNLIILMAAMMLVFFGTLYVTMFTSDEKRDVSILLSQLRSAN